MRAVVEAAGIHDILSKSYGSNNPINVVKAAFKGLSELRSPEEQAAARGKSVQEMGMRGARVETASTIGASASEDGDHGDTA